MNESRSKTGKRTFCGNKSLKGSQAYPAGFGRAVKQLILKNATIIRANKQRLLLLSKKSKNRMQKGDWKDADMESMMSMLLGA